MNSLIEIKNVSKSFDNALTLKNIHLDIRHGEFITLLGPSGCGKTTLLRMLSGLEQPDSGTIYLNNKDITTIAPEQRHINMVFQSYALFPHMNVFDNVAFGPRCQGIPQREIVKRVNDALQMVKLTDLANRKPHQLSGGQQQRVAIARAVVNEPIVLLLDEPLSALDYSLRKSMRMELKELQRRLGITFLLVTHDQEEALSMSDRVAVMNHGMIEQIGTPRNVYENPKTLFVAKFIGEHNIFTNRVSINADKHFQIEIEGKNMLLGHKHHLSIGQNISILIRPEDIRVWGQKEVTDAETANMLPGTVEQVIYKGSTVDLIVRLQSGKIISATQFFDEDDEKLEYEMGEKVWTHWIPGWEVIFPDEA